MKELHVRKSNTDTTLSEKDFKKRYRELFYDPYFDSLNSEIEKITETAWKAYSEGRKAPRTQKAGVDYHDPQYELSIEWLATKESIEEAQKIFQDRSAPRSVLLISAAHRNDQTCPGEISKTSRLFHIAQEEFQKEGIEVQTLHLDELTSEFGKKIHPCKACVSTAMPLCHWPCSCYPNHSLGQIQDWMNDIYPMWVRAHGVMIITPVYWHQSPSALKLMIDRLVCADGGNPDPTTTQGKRPELAKEMELKGWSYPKHLSGRVYSVVVHGDTVGIDETKTALTSTLEEMELISAGNFGNFARYIGYYEPYASSHDALDKDQAIQEEVRNAAKNLVLAIQAQKEHKLNSQIPDLKEPRVK